MFHYCDEIHAGGAFALLLTAGTISTPAQAALVGTFEGNDCSGVLGQGFANCAYNGSPIIIKFDFNSNGTVSATEINSALFPTVTGAEFSFAGTSGSSGTWTYNPG